MLEIIGTILLLLFAVLGMAETGRILTAFLLRPKKKGKVSVEVRFCGHNEEAEYILRSAIARMRWMGGREEKEILCIDEGMDPETRKVCEILARRYPIVHIGRKEADGK